MGVTAEVFNAWHLELGNQRSPSIPSETDVIGRGQRGGDEAAFDHEYQGDMDALPAQRRKTEPSRLGVKEKKEDERTSNHSQPYFAKP